MFGGAGLYREGVMFALLDDDVIYFRVDDALEADLKAQGSAPWVYSMKRDGGVATWVTGGCPKLRRMMRMRPSRSAGEPTLRR